MKTYIVIPTYNEAENIPSLIISLPPNLPIIIVDDNSPDGTADLAEKQGAIVIRRTERGIGSAIREGIKKALEDEGCTHILTMDADFSHSPLDIPSLLHSPPSALVVGSRYVKDGRIIGWNWKRKLMSRVANTLLFLYTHVHDNTANFRLYSRACAEVCVDVDGRDNDWLIMCLIKMRKLGVAVKEVPITFVNRKRGKSKIRWSNSLKWGIKVVREMCR